MTQLRNDLTLKLIGNVYEKATDQPLVVNGCELTAKTACVPVKEKLTLNQLFNLPTLADECHLPRQWTEVNNHSHSALGPLGLTKAMFLNESTFG